MVNDIITTFICENLEKHDYSRLKKKQFVSALEEIDRTPQLRGTWDALKYAADCIEKDVPATARMTEDEDGWYKFECPRCEAEYGWKFSGEDRLDNYCPVCGQRLTYVFYTVVGGEDDGRKENTATEGQSLQE